MLIIYTFILLIFSWYSYALIDPNITFFNHPLWSRFLEQMLQLGYYHRDISVCIYLVIVILLFIFHYYFTRHIEKYRSLTLAICIGIALVLSYPFLSHDFFNYLFDAKILTFYHQNPYLHKALDFPGDPWLRFMQWTHRSYPYGPVFLLISIIPSFLAFGKFLLSFVFYKITTVIFYFLAVYVLQKKNKKWAILFATHPLILVEGLVNGHNDLIALSLAVIGIYYLFDRKNILSRLMLLFSAGIKYMTLPLVFLVKKKELQNQIIFILLFVALGYLTVKSEIQPWYFLALLAFLPYYGEFISRLNIFFLGLLVSYYPYIFLGGWDKPEKVELKHMIIFIFGIINVAYLLIVYFKRSKTKFFIR